jgi:2-polyprenyl-3-methyl-5-hydroxy-6-metoxy-1,4-benzoquinol methylase
MKAMISCYPKTCDTGLTPVFEGFPYCSAPSGLDVLNTVKLKPHLKVLDIGSGSGYLLIELAQRLGNSCIVYGLEQGDEAPGRIGQ